MTVEQFGQTIKQRYPQYQNLDDASVGQKVIQQYPQYQNLIDQGAPQGNFLGKLLSSAASPFITTGKNIAGAAYEGGRALDQAVGSPVAKTMGNQNDYMDKSGNFINDPFLSQQDLQQINQNPLGFLGNQAKASAGVASYAVPFGKGANLLTKAIAPGAAVGAMQGASDPNANAGSIATNAALGAAGGAATSGIMKLLGLAAPVGETLDNSGNAVLRSQYRVTPQQSAKLDLPGAVKILQQQYGLSNMNHINDVAQKVTGANGLVTKLTRSAVAQADPLNTGGVMDFAKNLIENEGTLQAPHVQQNFINHIKNGINMMATGKNMEGGDPLQALDFIKKLEGKAAQYSQTNDVGTRELGSIYGTMASHLKDLLFEGSKGSKGANQVLTETLQSPENIQAFHNIHPQLGVNFEGVKDVGGLRSLAAPFVRASIAADQTANRSTHAVINPYDILAGLIGVHGFGLPGVLAGIATEKTLNSNVGKSVIGNLLSKTGAGVSRIASPSQGVQNTINSSASRIGPLLQQASQ